MKRPEKILIPALFAISAVAQSGSSILGSSTVITNPSDPGVVYVTYPICPTAGATTVTSPMSVYCPGPYCNGGPTIAPSSTVWVTEIIDYCATATNEAGWLTTMTTTITEACPCMETRAPGYVPSGFTNAVVTCTVCGESSPVATIMTPVISGAGAYAYATASAEAAAGAQAGSGPGSGFGSNAAASAAAGAGAGAGAGTGGGMGSAPGSPGSGSNSNAQASAAAAAGANIGTGSNNAAQYAPGSGPGSNSTFTPPISPSAGSGASSSPSGITPPIAIQSHSAAVRHSDINLVGTLLLGIAGLVAGLAWQL